jgi:hypothetical protein
MNNKLHEFKKDKKVITRFSIILGIIVSCGTSVFAGKAPSPSSAQRRAFFEGRAPRIARLLIRHIRPNMPRPPLNEIIAAAAALSKPRSSET